jgi:hypothetical protein
MPSMHKTKQRLLWALGATAMSGGLAGLVPGTQAQEILPTVVDMTVAVQSVPAEVAPPGELVVYEVTVGQGTLPTAGTVAVDLASGQAYRDDLTDGAITAAGADASCDAAGADVLCQVPAAAVTFEVVAHTAPTAGDQVVTATVTSTDPLLAPLEYTPNNAASATTDVQLREEEGQVSGLVENGKSITLTSTTDGRSYTLTVPEDSGSPGVIVTIALKGGADVQCPLLTNPTNTCGDGFSTVFVEDHPYFKAEDPEHPLVTVKTFGYLGPCVGYGGTCSDIYYAADVDSSIATKMPDCTGRSGAGPGDGDVVGPGGLVQKPCLNLKFKVGTTNWFEVLMLSNDPIEFPPVLRL